MIDKCFECGATLELLHDQEYDYVESGLDNVTLKGLTVCRCPDCKSVSPRIPHVRQLHLALGLAVVMKRTRLDGREIRFLRKELGLLAKEMASQLGYTQKNYSELENDKHPISDQGDKLMRLLFVFNKSREIVEYRDDLAALEYQRTLMEFVKRLGKLKSSQDLTISIDVDDIWSDIESQGRLESGREALPGNC